MTLETLDLKDRKILYILAQEARTPPSVIAKQVSLSKDAVKYRIKQLEKRGIIYNYLADLNTEVLGYRGYDLFLRFNTPPGEENKIGDYFDSHPNICWSCFLSGEWNYFAELICSSNEEFHRITKDLAATFAEQLEDYEYCMVGEVYRITQIVDSVYDGKGINMKDILPPTAYPWSEEKKFLDATEKKLLATISESARLPIHKIAEKSGLTPEVVRYRLRKLREDHVIIRTMPTINYSALGLVEYIVKINLKSLTPEKEKTVKLRISHIPAIKYSYRTLGEQSVFMIMNTKSVDELESILKSIRTDFFDIIKSVEYHHVTQHQRFTLFPDALRK